LDLTSICFLSMYIYIQEWRLNQQKWTNNGYFNPHSLGLKNLKCQQRTLNPGINKARVNSEGEDPPKQGYFYLQQCGRISFYRPCSLMWQRTSFRVAIKMRTATKTGIND
jgi:hypothetical protein